MLFIIKGTDEKVDVPYKDSNDVDHANEVACNNGLLQDSAVEYCEAEDAYIAPRDVVEFWQEYFKVTTENDQKLCELKEKYPADEVEKLYFENVGCDFPEPEDVKAALETVRNTLENRYSPKVAH